MKVMFLIPAYNNVPVRAYESIIELMSKASKDFQVFVSVRASCFVHENRNKLAYRALKAHKKVGLDYVFWLDSDIDFHFKDVLKLILSLQKSKADMMSGVYFTNVKGVVRPIVNVWSEKDELFYWLSPKEFVAQERVFKADSAGFGFVVMKPTVLERMVKEFERPFDLRVQKNGEMLGEDFVFFERASRIGLKLFVDKEVTVAHCKGVTDISTFENSLN